MALSARAVHFVSHSELCKNMHLSRYLLIHDTTVGEKVCWHPFPESTTSWACIVPVAFFTKKMGLASEKKPNRVDLRSVTCTQRLLHNLTSYIMRSFAQNRACPGLAGKICGSISTLHYYSLFEAHIRATTKFCSAKVPALEFADVRGPGIHEIEHSAI